MDDPGARHPAYGRGRGGVPGWMSDLFTYCSRCGGELDFGAMTGEDRERMVCRSCGFVAYANPRMVVTALPVNAAGEVVLLRRGIEPGYGAWAQPGGFLEIDETATQGAVRETLEETGLLIEPTSIVGLYSRPQAAIVVVVFEARIVGGEPTTGMEALEIAPFAPDAIPWPELAFDTTTWALRDWLRLVRPDLDVSVLGVGDAGT